MTDQKGNKLQNITEKLIVAAVVIVAFSVRAHILFSTDLIPGTDPAYYLIQTRSILETGSLAYGDTPLVFYIMAVVSWLVKAVFRLSTDSAVMVGVKLVASLVPALAAVPAYLLVKSFQKGEGSVLSMLPVIAAAVAATLSSGPIQLTADFMKNALGMVFLLFMAYYALRAIKDKSKESVFLAFVFLALCGASHVGAFSLALLFAGLLLVGWFIFVEGLNKRALKVIGAVSVSLAAVFGLLVAAGVSKITMIFDSIKSAFSYSAFMNVTRGFVPRGMGGTGEVSSLFLLLTMGLVVILLIKGKDMEKWELAAAFAACLATLFCLYTPAFVTFSNRFQNMAFGPGLVVWALLLRNLELKPGAAVAALVLVLMLWELPSSLRFMQKVTISQGVYEELSSLKNSIEEPANTLVVARHGLEYWAGWVLHVDAAQTMSANADKNGYSTVLYVQEKSSAMGRFQGDVGGAVNPSYGAPSRGSVQAYGFVPDNFQRTPPMQGPGNSANNAPPAPGLGGQMGGELGGPQQLDLGSATLMYDGSYISVYEIDQAH